MKAKTQRAAQFRKIKEIKTPERALKKVLMMLRKMKDRMTKIKCNKGEPVFYEMVF